MHKNTKMLIETMPRGFFMGEKASQNVIKKFNHSLCIKRHKFLKNKYEGETAFILACGPSLNEVWNEEFNEFLKDKLVITIKQAHYKDETISDFHLYNEMFMQEYKYPAETLKISVSKFMKEHAPHIHYPIEKYIYKESLFVTNEYARWDLKHSYVRPWGVGIMFEIGMQLPVYLGCKKIVITGFDMDGKGNYHFYDKKEDQDFKHYGVDEDQFYYAPRSIPHYLKWLEKYNIQAKLYSPLSALPFEKLNSFVEVKDFYEG